MSKRDKIKEIKTVRFELRLYPQTLEMIDNYRRKQKIIVSRAETLRRLLELGLRQEEKK